MSWTRLFGCVLSVGLLAATAARAAPPNVVFIISDDQGWTDYSFMGHPHLRTPHLDKLASQSLTFRHGYVPSSLCCPSLASVLTGLYPHQTKITGNDPPLPPGKTGAAANRDPTFLARRQEMVGFIDAVPTLPRLLAPLGYQSFQSGKWWQGSYRRGGFTHGMTHGDPQRGGRHGDAGLKIGRQGMQEVFDFLDLAAGQHQPFFLWYAPMMPHSPHNPPERFLAPYRDQAPSLEVAKYWGMCTWFDETCGQLLDHLDRKGLAEKTLVLYLSDNGWIQDPAADRYAPRSKRSPYDGGIRTPILVRWPGKVKPRQDDQPVLSIDFVPTVLAAAGLKPTPAMQGIDLLDDAAVHSRRAIFGEIFEHNAVDIHKPAANLDYRWVIADGWKLIVPAPQNVPDGRVELYHLADDPFEKSNRAGQEPGKVEQLRKQLDAWWAGKDR